MKRLLFEIGAEEIPAGYIEPALKALQENLLKKLTHARIDHGAATTFGTPRRLAVSVADVAEKQTPVTTEVMGPPEKVAFDATGQPTMAARKFAEKVGLSVAELGVTETPKGRYLCAVTADAGKSTETLLETILPELITAIPFPKTMKWADKQVLFARPIHSILALFGTKVVSFSFAGLQSDAWTWGHSIMRREQIPVPSPEAYVDILREADVIADITERKNRIIDEIQRCAEKVGGRVLPDEALLDIVTQLVECPLPVVGNFDAGYLELPGEILITAMREHQKYFAIIDASGSLMPHFIAINNTRTRDVALSVRGHERVLRARLEDARFFYRTDRAVALETWVSRLNNVLFQAKLGSVYDKVVRIGKIAEYLTAQLPCPPETAAHAIRAAFLCKADLMSQTVGEFPKLQGIMGRVYALAAGEPAAVATAIEEHYQPTYSGGALPQSLAGAVVAIADKIDTICGCFSAGLIPTGAADPYALRRQAIGIIQILLERNVSVSLMALIQTGTALFSSTADQNSAETAQKVYDFFSGRMTHLLSDLGYSRDVVAAVTSVTVDHVPNVWNRVRALEKLKAEPDFEPLAIAFKRVVNIIKKSDTAVGAALNEGLFEAPCEGDLLNAFKKVRAQVADNLNNHCFEEALRQIASLRGAVDAFFDGVMVMAEDETIRANRLALLGQISDLFAMFADFSKLST
ncbi:MAG: glycine--tRNA ligase subunit beta [Tenuifilaceae bacterium]|nr:glycine--tRNA ligase subunit beta [Tenuifilaceae bacterium]